MRERRAVDLVVPLERAGLRAPQASLGVEEQPVAVAGERLDGLRREVRAEEPGDLHPLGVGERRGRPAVESDVVQSSPTASTFMTRWSPS